MDYGIADKEICIITESIIGLVFTVVFDGWMLCIVGSWANNCDEVEERPDGVAPLPN